jgi:quercetin dioxygenase-like cupin family protein
VEPTFALFPDLTQLLDQVPEDSIVSRTFFNQGDTRAILFGFAAGQELSEHTAARPAILFFLEGRANLTLGEAAHDVRAGAWVHMAAHLPHSVYALTPVKMLLMLL